MIPKIIHYCWFGRKTKPVEVEYYISTWRKYCPDYIIKEWNELNFDIHVNKYVEEAYRNKKWAFVSDVARLWALVHEGGIYMDTDVEVVRNLDELLDQKAFLGFEGTQWVGTNIIGTEKNNEFFFDFLDSYNQRTFVGQDGKLELTTNVVEITKRLINKGLKRDGNLQIINGLTIYPPDHFSPYDYINGEMKKTPNTYTIHWFAKSWIKQNKFVQKLLMFYHRVFGIKMK